MYRLAHVRIPTARLPLNQKLARLFRGSALAANESKQEPLQEEPLRAHTGPFPARTHHCAALSAADAGQSVVLAGWLLPPAKMSKGFYFFPLRDPHGTVQLVVNDRVLGPATFDRIRATPAESTVLVAGTVRERPDRQKRPHPGGDIELAVESFLLLNPADKDLPFAPSDTRNLPSEERRLRYRYLDLRRPVLAHNIQRRGAVAHIVRTTLHEHGFVEVETPMLLKSTPEGAREFLVPTRLGFFDPTSAAQNPSPGPSPAAAPPPLESGAPPAGIDYLPPPSPSPPPSPPSRSHTSPPPRSPAPSSAPPPPLPQPQPLFYALPQSPQQPKQLLIASGAVERYYQIARCFRDEDGRRDRQPEFTQIDLEMAWVSWGAPGAATEADVATEAAEAAEAGRGDAGAVGAETAAEDLAAGAALESVATADPALSETTNENANAQESENESESKNATVAGDGWRIGGTEVRDVVETLVRTIWEKAEGVVLPARFPVMRYADAMARFGSDKPDTRFGLELQDVSEHLPESTLAALNRRSETVEALVVRAEDTAFRRVVGETMIDSFERGISRIDVGSSPLTTTIVASEEHMILSAPGVLQALVHELEMKKGDAVYLARRTRIAEGGSTILGRLRLTLSALAQSSGAFVLPAAPHFLWVTEFPLFTHADADKEFLAHGRWSSSHHPFTAPMWEDIEKLYNKRPEQIAEVRGQHYDLVLNGTEIGGGSVRVHDAVMQEYIFSKILQLDAAEIGRFGHLLHALRCGAPPHGGIALGFDRLMAILCKAESIRDVIAFPKTGAGTDPLFRSPAPSTDGVLAQYNICGRQGQ